MNKVLTGFQVLIFFAWILMSSTSVFAVEPDEVLNDPKLEERAREISKNLRCLVCRNVLSTIVTLNWLRILDF